MALLISEDSITSKVTEETLHVLYTGKSILTRTTQATKFTTSHDTCDKFKVRQSKSMPSLEGFLEVGAKTEKSISLHTVKVRKL